jgi:hypothetical protein
MEGGVRIRQHESGVPTVLLSSDMAREMLAAWFEPYDPNPGQSGIALLAQVDSRHRK